MIIKTRPSARANARMKLLDDTVPTDREVLSEYCAKPYLLENQAKIVPKPLQAVLNFQCRQNINNHLKSAILSKNSGTDRRPDRLNVPVGHSPLDPGIRRKKATWPGIGEREKSPYLHFTTYICAPFQPDYSFYHTIQA